MASKKPTTNKKTTLDTDYNKQAKMFTQEYKQLPIKKKKLKQLQTRLEILTQKKMCDMTTEEIKEFYQLKGDIAISEKDIAAVENFTDVTDFYLKNGELLLNYYDQLDQEKQEKKRGRPLKHKKTPESDVETGTSTTMLQFLGGTCDHNQPQRTSFQRADIHEQYLASTDPHHLAPIEYTEQDEYCEKCGEFRELMPMEALLVCPNCGDEVKAVIESDKPSYKDPPHENMYFAYKRINHFKEQLSHFQAKETTKIPQEVYDVILVEFKKEKKTNLAYLTRSRVKRYLQKYTHLDYNKYYENINQIICHLNGMQPLSMPPEVEEQLCNMFQKIQEPFERHCPPGRTNFLSYSYVIHKFCQLLGYYEYLPYFNLLKSKDKLHQQDKTWKKICADLGWKYYSSSN